MSTLYADNTAAQVGVTVTLSILIVTNLIGNSLVILIILTNKSMKSPMNYLLINLAVADIMVGLFFSTNYVFGHLFTHPDGLTGTILCKLLTGGNFAWVGSAASSFSLVAICFERYFAIVHPYSIKLKLNMGKLKFLVVICWLFAAAVTSPSFLTMVYQKKYNFCIEKWPKEKWLHIGYGALWIVLIGIIPITIMVVLYCRVIYILWFKRSEHQVQGTQLALLKSRKRVTKMVVIVSAIYAACWIPILSTYPIYHIAVESVFIVVALTSSVVMATCNSAVNPFIYTLQSEKFRRLLKELVCCRKQHQIQPNNQPTNSLNQPTNQLIKIPTRHQSTNTNNQPTNQPPAHQPRLNPPEPGSQTNQPTNQPPTNQLTNQTSCQPTNQPTDTKL